jgi:enoyl-CoA hydratase/carnithine racemase
MNAPQDILFERSGGLAIATLNRPKALNSLTLDMCVTYERQLAAWAGDDSVQAVVLKGAGERAFCAGGDVRAIWRAGKDGEPLTADFFRAEYRMNRRIEVFPKPHVALLDGVTMGGGVGISLHGSHRVATERTLIAMPETGIGMFPDVGGTHFLSRLPGGLGLYLGLTGARMKAADALHAGFATDFVPSGRLNELEAALAGPGDIAAAVRDLSTDPGPAPLIEHQAAIERCFVQDSLEAVIDALAGEPGDWAAKTLSVLTERCSPTSLKVTFEALRRAAKRDFDAAMTMEYRLSQAFMAGRDFYEGIRALLIDKDNAPAWDPASLAEVTPSMVEAYFAPLGDRDLSFD